MDEPNRIDRPMPALFGGGGANTPADREVRFHPYDATREEKS